MLYKTEVDGLVLVGRLRWLKFNAKSMKIRVQFMITTIAHYQENFYICPVAKLTVQPVSPSLKPNAVHTSVRLINVLPFKYTKTRILETPRCGYRSNVQNRCYMQTITIHTKTPVIRFLLLRRSVPLVFSRCYEGERRNTGPCRKGNQIHPY